jgi:predicted transcriptional regulator
MAFRPVKLGALLSVDSKAAHAKLVALFRKHGTLDAVAKSIGVDRHTVQRWISRLLKDGLVDPRTTKSKSGGTA